MNRELSKLTISDFKFLILNFKNLNAATKTRLGTSDLSE